MSINYSATTPAAPAGKTNVVFQSDGRGNISAYYTPSVGLITSLDCNSSTGLQGGLDCGEE
jgi:hypothetical protein